MSNEFGLLWALTVIFSLIALVFGSKRLRAYLLLVMAGCATGIGAIGAVMRDCQCSGGTRFELLLFLLLPLFIFMAPWFSKGFRRKMAELPDAEAD